MNRAMQLHTNAAAAHAHVHASYGTANGSWSICTNVPMTFDHKPRPRRSQVTIS